MTVENPLSAGSSTPRWGTPKFRQIPILLYHVVSSAAAFGADLDAIRAWGYTTITHDQLYTYLTTGDPSGLPDKPILIGLDDGGASNFTAAYPELQSRGMKATMYLIPNWIDGVITGASFGSLEASPITWANAVTMFGSGLIDFQSHSMSHLDQRTLGGVGAGGGNGSAAGQDFLAVKARIEQMIPGTVVRHQAQPYGGYNANVQAALRAAGCLTMRTVASGLEFDGSSNGRGANSVVLPTTDPLTLPVAGSTFADIKGMNYYGEAEYQGNMVQDGRFVAGALGWTKDPAFSVVSGTLPDGTTGNFLRAAPTATVTAYWDYLPIGFYSAAKVSGWFRATAPAASPRVFFETMKADRATASTVQADSIQVPVPTAAWTYFSGMVYSDGSWMWGRPKIAVGGAGGTFDIWDFKVMKLIRGGPAPF